MITKDMLIIEILNQPNSDECVNVLLNSGMGCLGCAMAHGETLEQAAAVHGVDVDALVAELNSVINA